LRLLKSRKGISEIIASLLIICITVSAATLFAAYASGLMGKIQPPAASQPYTEQFSAEYYNWNTLSTLTVNLRNTGVATVNLQTADYFVSGIEIATGSVSPGTCSSGTWSSVAPVVECPLTISGLGTTNPVTINSGIAYVLKIVLATDGATFTFSLIAGSNTH
jgi:flagellin-like protein